MRYKKSDLCKMKDYKHNNLINFLKYNFYKKSIAKTIK